MARASTLAVPTVDEILTAAGVNTAALKERITALLAQFPNGIPQQLLIDAIDNAVSSQALYAKVGECYVALVKLAQTGKGPVGHASVEVV